MESGGQDLISVMPWETWAQTQFCCLFTRFHEQVICKRRLLMPVPQGLMRTKHYSPHNVHRAVPCIGESESESVSCSATSDSVTSWTVAHPSEDQASLSMEFSRQEYWSGLPGSSPGDLPSPGIKPRHLHCRQIF